MTSALMDTCRCAFLEARQESEKKNQVEFEKEYKLVTEALVEAAKSEASGIDCAWTVLDAVRAALDKVGFVVGLFPAHKLGYAYDEDYTRITGWDDSESSFMDGARQKTYMFVAKN